MTTDVNADIHQLRGKIVSLCYKKGGHLGGSLSCIDVLYALHCKVMKAEDDFILSKGHAAPALYAILNFIGKLPDSVYTTYGDEGTQMIQHPSHHIEGITYSSGALGNGLSVGIGMKLSKDLSGETGRVFVLMGDGELNEGTVWEGLMYAAKSRPGGLVAIVDNNKLQASSDVDSIIPSSPLFSAIEKLGWEVAYVDGHNYDQIVETLSREHKPGEKPVMVVLDTIKGKGVSFMENDVSWHHRPLSDVEYNSAMKELA